jgi:hypothetical protein
MCVVFVVVTPLLPIDDDDDDDDGLISCLKSGANTLERLKKTCRDLINDTARGAHIFNLPFFIVEYW